MPVSPKSKILLKKKGFLAVPQAHLKEHSIEVQIPFLQCVLKNFELIPILAGQGFEKEIAGAIADIMDKRTLVIVSSDLSHYHPYNHAVKKDMGCVNVIKKMDIKSMFNEEACGARPIIILMYLAEQFGWKPALLDIRNSGDISGDKSRVVGYASMAFFCEIQKEYKKMDQAINVNDQEFLLKLARNTIARYLKDGTKPSPDPAALSHVLKEERGAFVTLHKNKALRGCIGCIVPRGPLYQAVIDNAVNAAVNDPRFSKVTADELKDLHIEISVLTKPENLNFDSPENLKNKLQPNVHGVILKFDGFRQSTFLPQVWEQLTDKDDFLSHLSSKAGMSSDAWKKPGMEVETYQAQVFGE
ncbi:AmmeMemoRadiSam system protein A [Patescibacteria group bacterium]|nr:AmmeMemoRadiSam system protein A [Patescibacteria group bacterium]